jgi:hypothetical protein
MGVTARKCSILAAGRFVDGTIEVRVTASWQYLNSGLGHAAIPVMIETITSRVSPLYSISGPALPDGDRSVSIRCESGAM